MNKTTTHYINGEWIEGAGEGFTSINPADASIVWSGTQATEEEIKAAYDSARNALPQWAALSLQARFQYLKNFSQQVEKKRQILTDLISKESGKPLWEAATEVSAVIGKIDLSLKSYQQRTTEQQMEQTEGSGYLRYKPHGVVAVLGPFNFPAHLSNGHIVPALLAGNTVIYKPSELTPAVAELIIGCWHEAGLPAGVLNCIQGNAICAKTLLQQNIQGVYFTGSYRTGLQIHQSFSLRPDVILALEMGGNNPLIIDKIEDQSTAIYYTILSTMLSAGQRCSCARRVLIKDNETGDKFLQQLIQACQNLRVGPYSDQPEPFMGPVISYTHALNHLKSQQSLQQVGGNLLLSMKLLAENTGLLTPGIIDMTKVNNPPDEEIFAPFVQIFRYQHFEQALQIANQTKYGLAAGLFSDDPLRYQQFYQTIRAGLINWNRPTTGAASNLPFGGIGQSGNHRPSAYFAADYCAYPIASLEQSQLTPPLSLLPGFK